MEFLKKTANNYFQDLCFHFCTVTRGAETTLTSHMHEAYGSRVWDPCYTYIFIATMQKKIFSKWKITLKWSSFFSAITVTIYFLKFVSRNIVKWTNSSRICPSRAWQRRPCPREASTPRSTRPRRWAARPTGITRTRTIIFATLPQFPQGLLLKIGSLQTETLFIFKNTVGPRYMR